MLRADEQERIDKKARHEDEPMATTKKSVKNSSGANEVDAFVQKLDHSLKAEIEAVRAIILGANPEISEGIKWNSPSFRVKEYFATIQKRWQKNVWHKNKA